jgi:hypothetical protein
LAALSTVWRILTFRGTIGRAPYAIAATTTVLVQHVVLQVAGQTMAPGFPLWGAHVSLVLIASGPQLNGAVLFAFGLWTGLATWILGAVTLCRARDAGKMFVLPTLVVLPIVQLGVIVYLSLAQPAAPRQADRPERLDWAPAALGVLAGGLITVLAVAVGALGFGAYGWVMFVLSPFVIGAVTAYLANQRTDLGFARTAPLVLGALWLGALSLLGLALEGVVCLVLASPLVVTLGLLGAAAGEGLARLTRRPVRDALAVIVLLPLAFATEHAMPDTTRFEARSSVDVAAPPPAVWRAITHMGAIEAPPSLPFRLGLAYPTAGVIHGEGVGAIREGHFSTGVAYERVTEWSPGRRLTFAVLSDAPSMTELSPYAQVNAPHVAGYFRTRTAQFDLTPLGGGWTRLTLTTEHELDLNPAFYWVPIAQWATAQNEARVLAHFRGLAERLAANHAPIATSPAAPAAPGRRRSAGAPPSGGTPVRR